MKPTLYAEDVEQMASNKLYHLRTTLQRFARVLPRRCPCKCHNLTPGALGECERCDKRGFLYPDPPDWWHDPYELIAEGDDLGRPQGDKDWRVFCEDMWRVLEIVEVRGAAMPETAESRGDETGPKPALHEAVGDAMHPEVEKWLRAAVACQQCEGTGHVVTYAQDQSILSDKECGGPHDAIVISQTESDESFRVTDIEVVYASAARLGYDPDTGEQMLTLPLPDGWRVR